MVEIEKKNMEPERRTKFLRVMNLLRRERERERERECRGRRSRLYPGSQRGQK